MTAPDRLAAIEARAQAATEGPWRYNPSKVNSVTREESVFAGPSGLTAVTIASTGPADDPQSMADAVFIAHARTDIPSLLAVVREQRAKLDRVEALCADMEAQPHTELGTIPGIAVLIRAAITGEEG